MPRANPAFPNVRERSLHDPFQWHRFRPTDLWLLDRAPTPAPPGNEGKLSYERLEFLGDAFLNFAVGDVLFRQDEEVAEGQLTETQQSTSINSSFT